MTINIKGKIGVEIECIALHKHRTALSNLCRELGYINSSDGSISHYDYAKYNAYEFKSKVYPITEIKQLFIDVKRFLRLVKVNSTCGLHMHISFEKMSDYYKILNWKVVKQFENNYNVTFTADNEQSRKSVHYCKFYNTEDVFISETKQQLENTHKGNFRYHSVNFNAFNQHNTIEFRIFAATNKILTFKKYVNFLLINLENFVTTENFVTLDLSKNVKVPKLKGKILINELITKDEIDQIKNGDSTCVI